MYSWVGWVGCSSKLTRLSQVDIQGLLRHLPPVRVHPLLCEFLQGKGQGKIALTDIERLLN